MECVSLDESYANHCSEYAHVRGGWNRDWVEKGMEDFFLTIFQENSNFTR